MGHQEEPPGYELWQTESLYTPVLQERHHSKARCITQTGLPVRQARMIKKIGWSEKNERRKNQRYAGHTVEVTQTLIWCFHFTCKDCLLNYAFLPIIIPLYFITLRNRILFYSSVCRLQHSKFEMYFFWCDVWFLKRKHISSSYLLAYLLSCLRVRWENWYLISVR